MASAKLATLVTIMLLGFCLQVRSISQAQGALGALAKLLPNIASMSDDMDGGQQLVEGQPRNPRIAKRPA